MFIVTVVSITSCKKTTGSATNGSDNLFTESLSNIQLREPVLLSFANADNGIVDWQITPDNNVEINKAGKYATVKFNSAGVYTVVGKSNSKQGTYIVTVLNTLYDDIGASFSVTASKIVGINANEEVLFTVHNAVDTPSWVINGYLPFTQFSADKKSALISFKGGSSATVTVTDGSKKQSRTVFINSASSTSLLDTVPLIFSDRINITPSLSTDKKTLYLTANTTYSYQCNTDKILSETDATNNEFTISYGGVVMATTPCLSITPATCINSFSNMPIGNFPFSINYENKTYTGTIDVSAAGVYTFNWTNNNLINISPLQVQ
jgi:hypothetical protein